MKIEFKADTHQYFDSEGNELISWSKFSNAFFPKFDPTGEIASRCATKRGISVEELKTEWNDKSDLSCAFGTLIHYYSEQYVEYFDHAYELYLATARHKPLSKELKYMDSVNDLMKEIKVLKTEQIVGSTKYKVAGQFDGLAEYKGKLVFIDYKTNDKTETELKNAWRKKGYGPCRHIGASQYNKYELQLSMYRYLAELAGVHLNAKESYIIHLKADGYTMYKCSYKRSVVKAMLEMYEKANFDMYILNCMLQPMELNKQDFKKCNIKDSNKGDTMEKVNAARWGMCFNRAHEEMLQVNDCSLPVVGDSWGEGLIELTNKYYMLTTKAVADLEKELNKVEDLDSLPTK